MESLAVILRKTYLLILVHVLGEHNIWCVLTVVLMGVPLAGQSGDVPSVHAGSSHTLSSFQIWHWNHEIERCKEYFLPTKRTVLQNVAIGLIVFNFKKH